MQPLDMGVFQPYKHWHDKAIQDVLAEFNTEYSLTRFCQDLTKIRDNTFTSSNIRSTFRKAEMWPISRGLCIKQLKKFAAPGVERPVRMLRGEQAMRGHLPGQKRANEDPPLPVLPARIQPQTFDDVEKGLIDWLL